MWRIICTKDIGGHFMADNVIDKFPEEQWIAADAKLTVLRRKYGTDAFKLLWN